MTDTEQLEDIKKRVLEVPEDDPKFWEKMDFLMAEFVSVACLVLDGKK